jgi:hypothetical protein
MRVYAPNMADNKFSFISSLALMLFVIWITGIAVSKALHLDQCFYAAFIYESWGRVALLQPLIIEILRFK